MDFGFETTALHIFLMRTRLEPRQVPENLFSMSFGEFKVRHVHTIFQKPRFLEEINIQSFRNPNYTTRGGFGHATDCLHARDNHRDPPAGRRNLLYESFPAGTMVDGALRAASMK